MANTIATFEQYVPTLDEVYQQASVTSVLDGAAELAQAGKNAGEIVVPKLDMDGLADYSRNGGYVGGDVSLTYQTVACNFDRGRMFNVDAMDNEETAGIAYMRLAAEFIRTKVVPELDAFRLATYASTTGVTVATAAALATGANSVAAIRAGLNAMDEDEVPYEDRYLFITPTVLDLIEDMDTTKSRAVLSAFAGIQKVPSSRFVTAITQLDGTSQGETTGGYAKASGATGINFMIIHKPAVIQFQKHVKPKVITPEQNQFGDTWRFGYRNVGIAQVYENKLAGVYVHPALS